MSMEHKAFVFDYRAFVDELSHILENSLLSNNSDNLINFIQQNLNFLQDPYEGEPLDNDWQSLLEITDIQQCGDFALTKYYDPQTDIGIGEKWQEIQTIFYQEYGQDSMILGRPFAKDNKFFDPGKMGSYFQSDHQVRENLILTKELLELNLPHTLVLINDYNPYQSNLNPSYT